MTQHGPVVSVWPWEQWQTRRIREAVLPEKPPELTAGEREAATAFLSDPQLLQRIVEDYGACGLVGEEANKLICYLACVSRLLPRPLSVLIQSSSAAGKTSVVEGTLRFMPAEAQVRMSSLTAQSLYYMGRDTLKHKILSVAEEEGAAQAAYALKLLQSEGQLSIACVGKESHTGRPQTQHYQVEGPVAMLLTTTAQEPDEELASRCLLLSVNEQPHQTSAIHQRQRQVYSVPVSDDQMQAVRARHQQAQRLLQPLTVVMPWAERLTFRTDQTRYRRDHATYLALIASLTLLHQVQRRRVTRHGRACVVASRDDVAVANRLMSDTMGARFEDLLPQTRLLLDQLSAYVARRVAAETIPRHQVRFTQRELRQALGWRDRSLRRQLSRLLHLEYLVAYRTGQGNGRAYQLLYDPETDAASWHLGLCDVGQLPVTEHATDTSKSPPPKR